MDGQQLNPADFTAGGQPEAVASRIVSKVLYMTRVGRLDVLWTVNDLARNVHQVERSMRSQIA